MFFLFNLLNPILIAAAILPAIALLVFVYRMDRLEKEPRPILRKLLLRGALSTLVAMALEYAGSYLMASASRGGGKLFDIIYFFIVVGLSEEAAKYFFLKKSTWFAESFDCQFDGVVYAVFVSLGFALAENICYCLEYGLGTALIRAVTAIPGHACFGVFMGAWYGIAKRYDNFGYPEKSRNARLMSLLLPTLLHGTYDYCATRESAVYSVIFIVFIAVMFITAFRLVRKLSAADQYIY